MVTTYPSRCSDLETSVRSQIRQGIRKLLRNTDCVFARIFLHKKGTTMYCRRFPIKQLITLICLLLAGITLSAPFASSTEAAAGGCRADPIVVLSDGTILDVTADIGTA